MQSLVRVDEIMRWTGYSRTSIYRMVKQKKFPAPIRLGHNTIAWLESDLQAWLAQRLAERDGAEGAPTE